MAYFGAKILHPSSVQPAKKENIPVRLKNTLCPDDEGTLITEDSPAKNVKAVAAKSGITAIKIKSTNMLLAYGFLRKVFEVFEAWKTPIDMIATSEVAVSLTIDCTEHLEEILKDLEKYGTIEVDRNMAIVCIVGDFSAGKSGLGAQVLKALEEVPLRMISYGGSAHNISVLVKEEDKKKEEVKPLTFDLENRFDRIVRLTVNSSRLSDAVLTPKGDVLYYLAAFEGDYDLWEHKLKENTTKILLKGVGGGALIPDKEGKNIFMCTRSQLKKIEIAGSKVTPIEFEAFFDYRPYGERAYIFDHVYQQVNDKFYVADLQGTDWKRYKEAYQRFLPHINNNYDFAEMLSELLGELNASHTGARYAGGGSALSTATLGVFYDESYSGTGLKIKEILDQSPFTQKKTDVKAGCIIEKVDGKTIEANADYFPLFEGKVGRKVILTVYDPATKKRFEETVKAISYGAQSELLYKRWVKRCAQKVEELSGGRIAYVHIKGMDSPSFRKMYSELLGRYRNKEAVIVDTRHNGGGWLHDDVVTLLSGKEYQRFVPRGQYIGSDPFNKWLKPSCMLACEDNYSNAHGTPYVYKTLGIGKLIGTPVAGTMTAVWWERQIDPSIVFGIPQVGCMDMQGKYLENQTLQPDILVYNEPGASLKGEDAQLKAAVDHLLKELSKKK